MNEIAESPAAIVAQSINATLYQLEQYTETHKINGQTVVFVPAHIMNAMKTWLREAAEIEKVR